VPIKEVVAAMFRLLMLEDDLLAAELALRALQSAGLPCACQRVENEVDFRAALARSPDLVLSDSNVPGFSGMAALEVTKTERPTTPFIFFSANLSGAAVGRALERGATAFVAKSDLERLPDIVRGALVSAPPSRRRASDRVRHGGAIPDAGDSAEYLLQRQATLERSLKQDSSKLSSLLSRNPPTPAALVLIDSPQTQERYIKLLRTADIDVEVAEDANDALHRLSEHTHALFFTDRLHLIRDARQLNAGSAIHIVLVSAAGEDATEGLRAGANDVMPEEGRGEQFWAHLTTARRIVSFATSLQSAITDNRLLSTIDELTRVGNRRYFEHQWPREVARALRFGRPLSLLMCDIDHFKGVNDRQGHQVGDAVLREFGERVTGGLRLGEDWVARVGGEEFAVVLPETGRLQARAIAERLRESINASPFLTSGLGLAVTASFGFCSFEGPHHRAPDLSERIFRLADAALYDSKHSGRNRVSGRSLHSGSANQ
jgi:two-component system, cell cycle response regulator